MVAFTFFRNKNREERLANFTLQSRNLPITQINHNRLLMYSAPSPGV